MIDIKHAEQIYENVKAKLKGQEGKIVAIDVDSEDYFIGANTIDAVDEGRKKHPAKQFYLKRVGAEYAFVVGAV